VHKSVKFYFKIANGCSENSKKTVVLLFLPHLVYVCVLAIERPSCIQCTVRSDTRQQVALLSFCPFTSTSPHLRCDVGLEEGIIEKNCLCVISIVYYYNGAQRYQQFLQVGRLYRALILVGLVFRAPLCLWSSWFYIFNFFLLTSFLLPFSELSLVVLALDVVD